MQGTLLNHYIPLNSHVSVFSVLHEISFKCHNLILLFIYFFSEEDYDAFCLAYMFTYRDFEMGTLGLAWTGDLKNAGGVCEKNGVSINKFV